MNKLSFVIPCYRSENTIRSVVNEIREVVAERPEYSYEIICVNDASPDHVYEVLKALANEDPQIKVVNLAKNMGKHAAVLAGYSFLSGDYVVNLDDDYQSPVPELWKLMEKMREEDCDVVFAQYNDRAQARWKNIGSNLNMKIGSVLLDKPQNLRFDNLSLLKRFVADEMVKYQNPYPYLEGLIYRVTRNIGTVEMDQRSRCDDNTTGYTLGKSIALFFNGFTAFSVKPLRISTIAGVVVAFAGFIWAVVILVRKLLGGITVAGYTSTMIIQLILGGMILMSLGLLGEYIGRIYISINNSPQYVIKNTINLD